MLSRNIADVNEALLNTVCQEHWLESQTLDFKRQLPEISDRGRQEFLKDVCAFANASGGDLVYGVQENPAAHADQLVPIDTAAHGIDATKRRLGQTLEAGLEPNLSGVSCHAVTLANGGYVLIVRVPSSFQGPHRYWEGGHTRWVVRADTHTVDLTYTQIRDAFDRGAMLADRAREFRDDRVSRVLSGANGRPLRSGPRCVVHLVPLAALAGRASIDVGALHNNARYADFRFHDWGGASRTLNFDGLLVHPGQPLDITYTQVFRIGAFEAARWIGALNVEPEDPERERMAIPSGVVTRFVRDAVIKFLQAAADWQISGPAIIGVSLIDLEGYRFAYAPPRDPTRYIKPDRPNLLLPDVWVDQLPVAQAAPDVVIRPALDTLWQSFDVEACPNYDAQGRWADRW